MKRNKKFIITLLAVLICVQSVFSDENQWVKNIYSSDYLYRFLTIYKSDADFSYFRNTINYGSIIYSIKLFLNEEQGDIVYSTAEILSLVTEFDKYSNVSNNTIIIKYFQSVPNNSYVFTPIIKTDSGNFCFKIDYYYESTIKKTGWFVYLAKYEIYRFFDKEPKNIDSIGNYDLEKNEKFFILLYLIYDNLWSININNSGIYKYEKQLKYIDMSFDEYIKHITKRLKTNVSYKELINELFYELEVVFPEDPMNKAIITDIIFKKIEREHL